MGNSKALLVKAFYESLSPVLGFCQEAWSRERALEKQNLDSRDS